MDVKTHELKVVEPYFTDLKTGKKTFELRFNDRDYQVGDVLILRKYDPEINKLFDDEVLTFTITHILSDYIDVLPPGYVILSIKPY